MGYAGPKAISKVNMILKDKQCNHGLLGNPLKKAKGQKLDESKIDASPDALARRKSILDKVDAADGRTSRPTKKTYSGSGLQKRGCKSKYSKRGPAKLTRASIKADKLAGKAEKAAQSSKFNKNERLVNRHNDFIKRKGLDKKKIAFG